MGDDWAEGHHDVCLMDESGTRLAARRLPEGLAGVGVLHEMIGEYTSDLAEVVVGVETDRRLWVAALVGAGYRVGVPPGGWTFPQRARRVLENGRCVWGRSSVGGGESTETQVLGWVQA